MILLRGLILILALVLLTPLGAQRGADPYLQQDIPGLLAALKAAPDSRSADIVAQAVSARWSETRSPTLSFLMARGTVAEEEGVYDLALKMYGAVVALRPDYAEVYHRRAGVRYARGNRSGALADLAQCLDRNPNHFGAWASLGAIFEDMGADAEALDAYDHALVLYPQWEQVKEAARRLKIRLEGRSA